MLMRTNGRTEIGSAYQIHIICLFVCFDSLRPIDNLSVKQGRVLLS